MGIGLLISFAIVVVLQGNAAIQRSKTITFVLLLIFIFGFMLLLIAKAAARVQKPDSESVIVPSHWDGFSKWSNAEKIPSAVQHNRMEFVFEVDDSGEGIPKDKQKSIFGSGLGIVQSLVRLMGGEIVIVDKEEGQKGTCIRFSALLTVSDTNHNNKTNIELGNKITRVGKRSFYFELPIRTSVPDPPDFAPTSHVVLLIDDKAQRRASRKLMGSLGITDGMVDPSDDVMLKPFHGAGLNEVIQLIPDFQRTTTPVEELASSSSSII
ncbi:Histidine kinase CKI1 [Linum perenne]